MLPTLKGKNIVLRAFKNSDAGDLQENANNKKIARFTFVPYPYKLKDAKSFIKRTRKNYRQKKEHNFAITLKKTNKAIGSISLMKLDFKNKNAELGYWLGEKYWGKGYTTEAGKLILRHAFNNLKLKRIYAMTFLSNKTSSKVLEKLGFKKEGILRKNVFRNNKFHDENLYAIVKK